MGSYDRTRQATANHTSDYAHAATRVDWIADGDAYSDHYDRAIEHATSYADLTRDIDAFADIDLYAHADAAARYSDTGYTHYHPDNLNSVADCDGAVRPVGTATATTAAADAGAADI
jgi:hypothetical protein